MPLSDRKKKILQVLVDDYIGNAEPISSKEIQEKHLQDCSSATIRNELSALESMGYLVQPHISSGRIPSQKAFRFYVDELLENKQLSEMDIDLIDKYFTSKINSVEDIVSNVAKVLTEITNYTSVGLEGTVETELINLIKLVPIQSNCALVIIITDYKVYKDNTISLPDSTSANEITTAEQWLNKIFVGKYTKDYAGDPELNEIYADFDAFNSLYKKVIDILHKVVSTRSKVITEGRSKIFDYPEYKDTNKAQDFIKTLEENNYLKDIFANDECSNIRLNIKIGKEDNPDLPSDCSLISTTISFKDRPIGSAGVIGPVRMDYSKVIAVFNHISKILDNILPDDKED